MSRGPRLDAPGVMHHVWARGIERRKIFLSDEDRLDFLGRLEIACTEDAAVIYAWCLMDNDFHLQLRTGVKPLSAIMRRLLTGYAMGFNKRHRRSGTLFQSRYKSTVVDEERYFLALVRYIHLNPLRAGLVKSIDGLATYRWSGYSVLMGHQKMDWQDVDDVLSRFGNRVGSARQRLSTFMSLAEAKEEESVFKGGLGTSVSTRPGLAQQRKSSKLMSDGRILGEGRFVESVLKRAESELAQVRHFKDAEQRRESFERLMVAVCKNLGVTNAELVGGSKRRLVSRARQVLSFVSLRNLGLSAAEVGRAIGVSGQSILKAAEQGPDVLQRLNLRVELLVK